MIDGQTASERSRGLLKARAQTRVSAPQEPSWWAETWATRRRRGGAALGQPPWKKRHLKGWEGEGVPRDRRAGGLVRVSCDAWDSTARQGWSDATGPAGETAMPVSHHSQPRHPWPTRSAPRGNWRQRVPAHPTSTTPKLEGLGDEVAWTRSLVIRAEPSPPVLPTVQGQEWGCEWRERHGPKGEGPVLRTRV